NGSANSAQSHPSRRISVNFAIPRLIRTSASQFRLFPGGYLQAALLQSGKTLTLDDPCPEATADALVSNGKEIRDFVLDLAHARVSEASGRLGACGKRIELSGRSSSAPRSEERRVGK